MTRHATVQLLFYLLACLASFGCAPSPVDVTAYGEEFVEVGIPADVFVDGWAVGFDRFDARLASVALEGGGEVVSDVVSERLVNLASASGGAGHALATLSPRRGFDTLTFTMGPNGEVPALSVVGSARKEDVVKSFAWSFESETRYACAPAAAASPEVRTAQLTIHADHLFYDDLDAEEPGVAFDLIAAADADDDGAVTRAELEATDITAEERYQVGSRDIVDLWGFLEAQSRTVGHIDGEGHCDTRG